MKHGFEEQGRGWRQHARAGYTLMAWELGHRPAFSSRKGALRKSSRKHGAGRSAALGEVEHGYAVLEEGARLDAGAGAGLGALAVHGDEAAKVKELTCGTARERRGGGKRKAAAGPVAEQALQQETRRRGPWPSEQSAAG